MNSVKKYILYGCILTASMGLFSCDKDLNNEKKDVLTDATQWVSEANADIAINDVYDQLPDIYGQPEQFDNFTDDNDPDHYYASWKWKGGVIDPASTNYALFGGAAVGIATINRYNWAGLYQAIRKCNNTMQQITLNKKNFSDAWYNKRMDELRFHRAFHYSSLLQNWGGVPLVLTAQTREDSAALFLKRSTFAETFDFITKTLDTILNNKYLAVKYNKGNADAGRATLGAAQMLKAYMQLVAASPLHNAATYPGGADPNKFVTFGNTDPARWATAAASFKKFMDDWGGPGKQYSLSPDDSTIWYESNEYNPESIFDRQYVANTKGSSLEYYGGVVYVLSAYQTWGNYNPTQELVDQFYMANGKPITDPTSGYNPQQPYVGRESRFYKWIVYDGAPYKMDWMSATDTVYTRLGKGSLNQIDFGLNDWTNTGYYFKKKLNPPTRPAAGASGANYIYFRYTEVLLGYAEAQNEAVGPDASVYSAINAIRSRVGLPALPANLSQSQMRDAIRLERRIELCFENKRFFDIKRWKIGEQVLTTDLHGMKIESIGGVLKYTPIGLSDAPSTTVHPHSFVPKVYMQPIPVPVLNQNPNLVQNPGY
ncbi:MAG TPA: RagB/SusD family nutrient uptake outer membrane protein [Chitinophagaceae bacterium]|nr:RagB/SusD family nutrient uptake outer membrane protein [Chitinophagaceae bacterium]